VVDVLLLVDERLLKEENVEKRIVEERKLSCAPCGRIQVKLNAISTTKEDFAGITLSGFYSIQHFHRCRTTRNE
jgi:hypothetical protein